MTMDIEGTDKEEITVDQVLEHLGHKPKRIKKKSATERFIELLKEMEGD